MTREHHAEHTAQEKQLFYTESVLSTALARSRKTKHKQVVRKIMLLSLTQGNAVFEIEHDFKTKPALCFNY